MKDSQIHRVLFLAVVISALVCGGCKTRTIVVEAPPPALPMQLSGTELDPYDMSKVRSSEAVHAYFLGPYIDPQDSGIRHDGHRISRIERGAAWNLSPNAPTAVPLGPVVAVADPASQIAPLSAELESKIVQANNLIAALIEQNEELEAKLKAKDKEIEALSLRVSKIEEE